jgi:phytoene dehydrogenase-like protein
MHGEIGARRAVVADVSAPALYAKLIAAEHLPASVLADIRRFQWDCSTVKVDFALDTPIAWSASDARRAGTLHIADDFDNLTEHAADLAMGRLPARPFLLFGQQSMTDPTRAPVGSETAWAYTRVPRTIRADGRGELDVTGNGADRVGEIARDGASEPWLDGFVERIEQRIEALAPGFRSTIRARHVFSPASLQDGNANLVGGALGGGTALPHQQLVFRPIPGFGRAETPITALYLASASAHPGPGVHGAAGANAARAALAPWRHARSIAFGRGPLRRAHMRR